MKALSTDLCNNILARGKKEKIPLTPMKLQKLMFYTCRDYARREGDLPINENFEVWQYGPVLPSVYKAFRNYQGDVITSYSKDARGKSYQVDESKYPSLKSSLDFIWTTMKGISGYDLSLKSHADNSAWSIANRQGRRIITLEDILNDKS